MSPRFKFPYNEGRVSNTEEQIENVTVKCAAKSPKPLGKDIMKTGGFLLICFEEQSYGAGREHMCKADTTSLRKVFKQSQGSRAPNHNSWEALTLCDVKWIICL